MGRIKRCKSEAFPVQKQRRPYRKRQQIHAEKSPQEVRAKLERERFHLTSNLLDFVSGYRSSDGRAHGRKLKKVRWIWAYLKFLALFEDIPFEKNMDAHHLLNLLLYGPNSSTKDQNTSQDENFKPVISGPSTATILRPDIPTLIQRSPLRILRYIKRVTSQLKYAVSTGKRFETEGHAHDIALQTICQGMNELRQAQLALQIAKQNNFANCSVDARPVVEKNGKDASVRNMFTSRCRVDYLRRSQQKKLVDVTNTVNRFTKEDPIVIDPDDYATIPNKDDYQIIEVVVHSPSRFQSEKALLNDEETIGRNPRLILRSGVRGFQWEASHINCHQICYILNCKVCHQKVVKSSKDPHIIYLTHDGRHPPISRVMKKMNQRPLKRCLAPVEAAEANETSKQQRKTALLIPLQTNGTKNLPPQMIYKPPVTDISCGINKPSVNIAASRINYQFLERNNFDIAVDSKMPAQSTSFENVLPLRLPPSNFHERNTPPSFSDIFDDLSLPQSDSQMNNINYEYFTNINDNLLSIHNNNYEYLTNCHLNLSNLSKHRDSTFGDNVQSTILNNLDTKILKHTIPLQKCEKCHLKKCVEASCDHLVFDFISNPECRNDFSTEYGIVSTAQSTDTLPDHSMDDILSLSNSYSVPNLSPEKRCFAPVEAETSETVKQQRKRAVLVPLQTDETTNLPTQMIRKPPLMDISCSINKLPTELADSKISSLYSEGSDVAVNSKKLMESTNFENVSPLKLPVSNIPEKSYDQSVLDFISSLDCPAYDFSTECGINYTAQSAETFPYFSMHSIVSLGKPHSPQNIFNDRNSLSPVKFNGSHPCCDSSCKPSGTEWKCVSRSNESKLLSVSSNSNSLPFNGSVIRI